MSADLESAIARAWDERASVTPASKDVREPVEAALELLDSGQARVAEPDGNGGWKVNQWLKQAVLLSFRLNDNRVVEAGGRARRPMTKSRASSKAGARTAFATPASGWSRVRSRGAAAISRAAWC